MTLCRKFDDKNELDSEGDDSKELNKRDGAQKQVIMKKKDIL